MKKIRLLHELKTIAKHKAFPYQVEAFEAVKDLDYAAIFHEQGLGKTKIAIDILLYWLEKTSIDTVLIVTKKQLVQNWKNELVSHTFIKPVIITNNRNDNHFIFVGPARLVVTNFETLQTEKVQFALFLKTRNVGIIIDESAKLKNPDAALTQIYFELSPLFKKKIIMTGTPVANRPYDIWSQIFFLDHGKSLGNDFNEFKKITNLSNNLSKDTKLQQVLEDSISGIFEKIKQFTVRETKNSNIVTLPDKIYIRKEVVLSDEQYNFYNQIRKQFQIEIVKNGLKTLDDSSAIVKRLLRLVQATSNPRLIDEAYRGESAKEGVLNKMIDAILGNGEKCIVWTNYIENVDYLYKSYRDIGCVKIHGGMKMSDRNNSVIKFKSPGYKILFATPASSKEGLTLTEANHVIFYDRSFSLDDYLQAQDRIHRISQKKTCYIYNLIAKGTIDEWIDVLLKTKLNAAALTQGDITLDHYRETVDYSFGDIIKEILNIQNMTEERL
jgi:SNF2 family DNA or RNA helicase